MEPKRTLTHKVVRVKVTFEDTVNYHNNNQGAPEDISHRDMVAAAFLQKGYVVVNYAELKYFARPWGVLIEGETNKSILSK